MSSLTLAAVLQTTMFATTAIGGAATNALKADDYATARAKTTKTGQPIVILVGAEWCPACVEMKQNVIPEIRKRGLFRRIAFAMVNLDQEAKLANQLTDGGPIPQMLMYRKTRQGWLRRTLVGGQDPKTVENFIQQGIELDEAAKKAMISERNSATR